MNEKVADFCFVLIFVTIFFYLLQSNDQKLFRNKLSIVLRIEFQSSFVQSLNQYTKSEKCQ